jgi:hypothetical protein
MKAWEIEESGLYVCHVCHWIVQVNAGAVAFDPATWHHTHYTWKKFVGRNGINSDRTFTRLM